MLDDDDVIVTNPTIRTLSPISRALSGPPQSSTAGRPIVNLSFALNYAAGGLNPAGYHAVNLVIHILCGLVLFGIIRRTLSHLPHPPHLPDLVAFFSALVWLLHPLETEVVDYVTQRTESLMALAYLMTLYGFIRGSESDHRWRWYGVSIASCWLGMLCKESMATAPVMVLLYDVVFCAGSLSKALRERAALYGGLAASWIGSGCPPRIKRSIAQRRICERSHRVDLSPEPGADRASVSEACPVANRIGLRLRAAESRPRCRPRFPRRCRFSCW